MVKLTVTLPDAHYAALLAEARRSGKPINRIIQECLELVELVAPPRPHSEDLPAAPATAPCMVLNKYTYQELGRLGDISREGLLLIAPKLLPLDRGLDVIIKGATESRNIELHIEPRWSKPDPSASDRYSIGCEISHINAADMELLIQRSSRLDLSAGGKRDTRTNLVFYLNVLDSNGAQLGHVGDISARGFLLIAEQPLPLEKILTIRIELPDLEEFPRRYIDAEVETRWVKPDVNPELHCTGCLFIRISPENAALVTQVQDILGLG